MHSREEGRGTAQQPTLAHGQNLISTLLMLSIRVLCVPHGSSLGMAGLAAGLEHPCPSQTTHHPSVPGCGLGLTISHSAQM